MERIDGNEHDHNSPEPRMNVFDDVKITMLPIVFTKRLDKMDSINTNWEPLSFNKITTMLLEESKPEYNPGNVSTSTVTDLKSYNKLENKLKTFQSTKSQFKDLNLKSIIEMALNNIKLSTANQNFQEECNSSIIVKNETESWSSDDDEALVSVKRKKIETPKDIDSHSQKTTEIKAPAELQKDTKTLDEILVETPIKNINELIQNKNSKVQFKPKKDTTTVAEVQSQLKNEFMINVPLNNLKTKAKKDDDKVVKVKRRRPSKDIDKANQKKNQTDVPDKDNESQTKNKTEIPARQRYMKSVQDTMTNGIENQSQNKNQTQTPAEQNENKSPVMNIIQNVKKKIRLQDIGDMSIYLNNTGLMAKQQKVTEERYDIGKDGNLEKFFVKSQQRRDYKRFLIERTVCCLYKRAQVIAEILDKYDINPTALNFMRAAHLCEVGACLCCCKPHRSSASQSDASLTSRILDRNIESSLILSNSPRASESGTSIPNENLYASEKVVKQLLSHNYILSIGLKGLITSLITNFKGITLTSGSTGKLSAVFNTTSTSWNSTDVQLITTILSKIRAELYLSKIPPNEFCACVNEALNEDNLVYSQASTLLGSKQLILLKQYSLAHFQNDYNKVSKPEDPKIEYFRGDPKQLLTPVPETPEAETKKRRRTIRNIGENKYEPRKKRNPKKYTKQPPTNKSPEALRECVFIPEPTPEETTETVPPKSDDTVPTKNPILHHLLATSSPQSEEPDKSVTQVPLQYLVSVPVTENSCEQPEQGPRKNVQTQTEIDIVTINLSSDEETILP